MGRVDVNRTLFKRLPITNQTPTHRRRRYAATFQSRILTATFNSLMAQHLGLGLVLTLGAVLQLIAHLLRFWNPPFGLYLISFPLQAAGMAYQDSHSNSFVASINGAHRWLGFIHAIYVLGCLVSPFVATAIANELDESWPLFYTFLVGVGLVNVLAALYSFRDSLRTVTRPCT